MTAIIPRAIAYYLPQYHPIPENDAWWGKGFTEWTNVTKAKPLFPGHYQPHIPADLGYYDLRVEETREAQADMAREYGIEGFCYYHYWFGGKRLLERPFNEVLKSGKPNFPFCLCWANESWTGVWHGAPNHILIEQTYPGLKDFEEHFYLLLNTFCDHRYITVEGKPLLIIYEPSKIPDSIRVLEFWRELAHKAGLNGLYIVGMQNEPWTPAAHGYDGSIVRNLSYSLYQVYTSENKYIRKMKKELRSILGLPTNVFEYKKVLPYLIMQEAYKTNVYPVVIPNFDNSPRAGKNGRILHGSTPELFGYHLQSCLEQIHKKPAEHQLIFIKSWNEWAEGNYLEPDLRYGRKYLEVYHDIISAFHS